MRISTSTLFNANVTQLNSLESSLVQTQQQISTGRRIVTPADDPTAAAQVLQVTQTQETNKQYIANIGTANDAVTLAEGTMQSISSLLQNVQSTAVSAGNAALSNSDRKSLASTLQANLTQLVSFANTKDANGNYLFSGFKANTQPFVQTPTGVQYNGDNGQRMIQVSPNQQVAASDSGASIFMGIKNGSGTFVSGPAGIGANILANATAPAASIPVSFSTTPTTFTVDGVSVTVNQDVTVPGTGTGPGTLAASIQSGLTAAGLTSYSVSAAAGGGLQITHAGSATPVAIAGTDATAQANGIVDGLGTPANSGSGVISAVSIVNPPPTAAQMGNSYQIAFNVAGGVTTYSITGADANGVALPAASLPAPSTNLPYTSGQSISFNGIQFDIQGTPANGDTFAVTPSGNESVFTTITNLINTLNTGINPKDPASQAFMSAGLSHAQDSLSNALSNILTVQSSQGARMNQLTAMSTNGSNLDVQYQQDIANLQSVDINKAYSDLVQQKTILTAAQQSFVQIENLSLFNYLR